MLGPVDRPNDARASWQLAAVDGKDSLALNSKNPRHEAADYANVVVRPANSKESRAADGTWSRVPQLQEDAADDADVEEEEDADIEERRQICFENALDGVEGL